MLGNSTPSLGTTGVHLDKGPTNTSALGSCLVPWLLPFTLFFDDGDVDQPASNLCDAGGDINGLHLQLLLIIIILPDEERDTDIHQLHGFLELHHPVSIWGKG